MYLSLTLKSSAALWPCEIPMRGDEDYFLIPQTSRRQNNLEVTVCLYNEMCKAITLMPPKMLHSWVVCVWFLMWLSLMGQNFSSVSIVKLSQRAPMSSLFVFGNWTTTRFTFARYMLPGQKGVAAEVKVKGNYQICKFS